MKRIWLWLVVVSLLAACAPTRSVFSPPSFEARTVEVVRIDPPGIGSEALVIGVDLVVRNPNPVGLSLRDVELTLALGGERVARSSLPAGLGLPASGSAEVRIEVDVPWSGAPSLVGQLGGYLSGSPLAYRIEAAVTADLLGVPQRFGDVPVAQGQLDPPVPWLVPTVRLDPAGARLTLNGATLTLEVGVLVDNPSLLGATVRSPGLDLRLDGRPLGSIGVRPTALAAFSTARVPVRLEVSLVDIGATLAARLAAGRTGDLEVALAGGWRFEAAGTTLGDLDGWLGLGEVQ